jgi:hypothetical protein
MTNFYSPISKDNHYRISFPKKGFQLVEFLKKPSEISLPFVEAVKACQTIYEEFSRPLNICLSGGLDSECVAQAALSSGVPFYISIFKYKDKLNEHDIKFARSFCQQNNLKFNEIDIDVIRFYETGESLEYALKYRTNSPQFAVYLKCAEKLDDVCLFAGTNPYFIHFNLDGSLSEVPKLFTPSDKEYCLDRLFINNKKLGVGHFFQYTPELYFSFLFKTVAGANRNQRLAYKISNQYEFKKNIFEQAGFNTNNFPERNTKFTGFENIKKYYAERYNILDAYEQFFRMPLEALFPPEIEITTITKFDCEKDFYGAVKN